MQTRRLAGVGLGLAATVTFAVAGCTGGGANPGPSASATGTGAPATASPSASGGSDATGDARAALAASVRDLGTTSFKVTMTSGSTLSMTGQMDPPNRAGQSTLQVAAGTSSLKVDTVLVGDDLYVRLAGAGNGKWMHIDVNRLPAGANVGIRPGQIDPANAERLLAASTDVRQTGARDFAGTLDLTRAVGVTGISKVTVDGYGEAAKSVPFRATLDDQARLSTLTIDLPALGSQPAQPLEVRYFDYGTAVSVQKPAAGDVTEAPESVYSALGG